MTEYKFTLYGNIPPKKNSKRIFRSRRTGKPVVLPSESHEAWHKKVMYYLKFEAKDKGGVFPLQKVAHLKVTLYYGSLHQKDNTNTAESVHDALVDAGIIADDSWKICPHTEQIAVYRKGLPGAEIILTTDRILFDK